MNPPSHQGLLLAIEEQRLALRRFLIARTGSEADADDLLSDLWIKVTQGGSGPIGNPRAYLFRMANNLVLDRFRETKRRERRESEWTEEQHGSVRPSTVVPDAEPTAEERLIERGELHRLSQAIAKLPAGAQRVLRMHKLEGLSHSEVAARLGISKSAVEKHMAVAINHLRKMLES